MIFVEPAFCQSSCGDLITCLLLVCVHLYEYLWTIKAEFLILLLPYTCAWGLHILHQCVHPTTLCWTTRNLDHCEILWSKSAPLNSFLYIFFSTLASSFHHLFNNCWMSGTRYTILTLLTQQPLYNMFHYNTVLDITRFKDGSQKCIDYIEK